MGYLDLRGLRLFQQVMKTKLSQKLDKINGKALVSKNFTSAERAKLEAMQDELGVADVPSFGNVTVEGAVTGARYR